MPPSMYVWNVRLISKKVKERNFINLSPVEKDGAVRLDVVPFPPHTGNAKKGIPLYVDDDREL